MAGAKSGVHVLQLKPIKVPEALIKGNKFIKWEEVSPTAKLILNNYPEHFTGTLWPHM